LAQHAPAILAGVGGALVVFIGMYCLCCRTPPQARAALQAHRHGREPRFDAQAPPRGGYPAVGTELDNSKGYL
jgi:hypothetical protein